MAPSRRTNHAAPIALAASAQLPPRHPASGDPPEDSKGPSPLHDLISASQSLQEAHKPHAWQRLTVPWPRPRNSSRLRIQHVNSSISSRRPQAPGRGPGRSRPDHRPRARIPPAGPRRKATGKSGDAHGKPKITRCGPVDNYADDKGRPGELDEYEADDHKRSQQRQQPAPMRIFRDYRPARMSPAKHRGKPAFRWQSAGD